MKNFVIVLVVVALLGVGGWYYMDMNKDKGASMETGKVMAGADANVEDTSAPKDAASGQASGKVAEGAVKEFTVDGSNFKFAPASLSVKKGDTVKITFTNVQGFHDFVIDEFKVRTPQIKEGQAVVEFVADKAGSFEYYCSVGSHRSMGMKGTLVVSE